MNTRWWLSVAFFVVVLVTTIQGQALAGNNYVEKQLLCALDKAPCDLLGRQVKDALPEIIGRNCQRCDQRQVANARRIAQFVQSKYPDVWKALVNKYSRQQSTEEQ